MRYIVVFALLFSTQMLTATVEDCDVEQAEDCDLEEQSEDFSGPYNHPTDPLELLRWCSKQISNFGSACEELLFSRE